MSLPTDSKARKDIPLVSGLLDYFPNALAAVADVSRVGNEQHNPGEAMHWAMNKSTDEADCIVRHLVDRGTLDKDGLRHSAKVAWRGLALLERELIAAGATPGRSAKDAPDGLWIEPKGNMFDTRFHCTHEGGDDCYHLTSDGFVDGFCVTQKHVAPCAWAKPGRVFKTIGGVGRERDHRHGAALPGREGG